MKRNLILFSAILLLTSCGTGGDKLKTVTVDNRYSISIPSFLTEAKNLNDDASLQYQHALREFYVIVIDEPISDVQNILKDNDLTDLYSDDIGGYSDLVIAGIEQNILAPQKSTPIDTLVNNMPARLFTISGRFDHVDIFYSLGFIAGKERYYQIMTWTLLNKKEQYKEKMSKIIYSFTEI